MRTYADITGLGLGATITGNERGVSLSGTLSTGAFGIKDGPIEGPASGPPWLWDDIPELWDSIPRTFDNF